MDEFMTRETILETETIYHRKKKGGIFCLVWKDPVSITQFCVLESAFILPTHRSFTTTIAVLKNGRRLVRPGARCGTGIVHYLVSPTSL